MIQRYTDQGSPTNSNTGWCLASDVAALEAENERLRSDLETVTGQRSELRRTNYELNRTLSSSFAKRGHLSDELDNLRTQLATARGHKWVEVTDEHSFVDGVYLGVNGDFHGIVHVYGGEYFTRGEWEDMPKPTHLQVPSLGPIGEPL